MLPAWPTGASRSPLRSYRSCRITSSQCTFSSSSFCLQNSPKPGWCTWGYSSAGTGSVDWLYDRYTGGSSAVACVMGEASAKSLWAFGVSVSAGLSP